MMKKQRVIWLILTICILAATAPRLLAVVQPKDSPLVDKTFVSSDLRMRAEIRSPDAAPAKSAADLTSALSALGASPEHARVDVRGGRWSTLLLASPMLPGKGVGNTLSWDALKVTEPRDTAALERAAWDAFVGFLASHKQQMGIAPEELVPGRVTAHRNAELIQIHAPRIYDGLTVRGAYVKATVRHGNLILFGASRWGDIGISTKPDLSLEDALAAARGFLEPHPISGFWGRHELVIVPAAGAGKPGKASAFGDGYRHRLAWVVRPKFQGELARFEILVDAHSGDVLSFLDTNHYATTRRVQGGVLPESNDGIGPEGVEQAGWPMPFADVSTAVCGNGVCEPASGEDCVSCAADCNGVQGGKPSGRFCCGDGDGTNPVGCGDSRCTSGGFQCSATAGSSFFTDSGGNLLTCVDGSITTTLAGRFMRMNDNCGVLSESSTGDIDLGTSGIDCNVAAGASPGNTRASRSGFYEMTRIIEMAQGQTPGNSWVRDQLLANMNINLTCNAFWSGVDVNFYRSGGGCNNTGELAGVYDHEWGHGYDDNDADGVISNPGEAVADVYAFLRLATSCIGRGFLLGSGCGGYGDPCISNGSFVCDGVRDSDWANHASGAPHTIANFVLDGSGTANGGCQGFGSQFGPCGGEVHCEGQVGAEIVYDLLARDLPAVGHDANTSLEIATRLTFLGASMVGDWWTCSGDGNDGCNADGAYLNFLAADDNDGSLANGTPNMAAIFAAFDRHGAACNTPAVQNVDCAPASAPVLSASARDRGASLSWTDVGASSYEIFRTEGVKGCSLGKTKIGETSGTSFLAESLQNGRDYFFTVVPIGSADSCLGPASNCVQVIPAPGPNVAIGGEALVIAGGDGDPFLDNCETGTWSFDVDNIGLGTQTNVRIVSVVPSNAGVTVVTPLPSTISASLAECATASGSFDFIAGGLAFNESVTFTVGVTSDQLPSVKTVVFGVELAESDFQATASKTYTFEAGTEGWTVIEGTFDRTSAGGGAQGTSWYEASSAELPDQCDHIRSPVIGLSPSSSLSVWNQFDIEGFFAQGGVWYDRANIGILDVGDGSRSLIEPDGGRLYNASGPNGTCGTSGQSGWADAATAWGESTFSSSVLAASAFAGQPIRLEVRYGTDPAAQGFGFHFDQVTLTDVSEQVADGQPDVCPVCPNAICEAPFEDQCSCPQDCGNPPASEAGLCTDTIDNDCDGDVDCDDADCFGIDPACPSVVCGDGVCDTTPGSGENCLTCPQDCNGTQGGKPSSRFCCGDGGGENPVDCGDSRCSSGGFLCI